MEKREKIRKYFSKGYMDNSQIGIPYVLIVGVCMVGLSIFVFNLNRGPNVFLGLLCLLIGLGLLFWAKAQIDFESSRPKDYEMDSWLEEDIQEVIKNRPYDKLGISKEDLVAETLLVVGPVYWYVSGFDVKDILMKKGEDGFNRFSIWTIQVFMFTENYLCSYKCQYNWIKNTYINESTNEFFYKDVVSVKTDTVSSAYTLMNGQRLIHSEAFQLKLTGDEITVITNDASLNTSSAMVSKAEKAVQSIRTMLRDKKK